MPIRPPPYSWVLRSKNVEELLVAARGIAEELGFEVSRTSVDAADSIVITGDDNAIEAAAERYDSCRDEIEAPADDEQYRFVIHLLAPDEDDPRPRIEVPPYGDNWAAWSVIGPLAEEVAERVGAVEITGDPPYWMQTELARDEGPTPETLPFLALRAPLVFPGLGTTTTFGRPASVALIERLLDAGMTRVALVLQRDPSIEDFPSALEDVEGIGVDARIVRTVRQEQGFIVAFKGIARVRVLGIDSGVDPARSRVERVEPAANPHGFAALRKFASIDPFVIDAAGAAILGRIEELDAGFLADLVARANGDATLARSALLEVDPAKRARLVEDATRAR